VPDAATAATPVPAADPAAPTAPQAGAVMTAGPEPATPEPPGTTSAADVSPAAVPAPVVAAIAPPPGPAPVEPAPARPAAAEPPAPAAAAPAAILLSGDTARVLQPAGDAAAVPAGTVSIDAISYTAGGEVALSGRGAAQAFVRLYLDNRPVLETAVAEDGSWGGTLPAVAPGVYTLRADQVAASGRVTSRYETPFQREDPVALAAPDPATGGSAPGPAADPAVSGAGRVSITVQPGFTLWQIARETYGDGTLYVRVYDANRSLIRDPDLIYPGQVFSVPTGE
jgi:nucleoid-associated protein YgaU